MYSVNGNMNNLKLAQSEASKRARSFVLPELSGFFVFLRDSQLGNCHWNIYYDIRKVLLRMKSKEQFRNNEFCKAK